MLLGDEPEPLEGNIKATTTFMVAMTPKTFEILSSTIYSDKVLAVLRELSTNAYDSHVENGNPDEPFQVQLPSAFKPEFFIRDYGTGMPNDKLEKLYVTYFDSDKTKSNNTVGCFGLGSKSPFAYTNSFTIESYYNGVRSTYIASFNKGELPSLAKMDENPTTERNGLKISFACSNSDIYTFHEKAKNLYKWFAVKPKANFDIPEQPTPFIKESDFWICDGNSYQSYLVMGNVAYPINLKAMSRHVVIFAKIGDVRITSSRESLEYDQEGKTQAYLDAKLIDINKRVIIYIEDKVKNAPTYWDACKEYAQFNFNLGSQKPQYKGKDLVSEFNFSKGEIEVSKLRFGRRDKLIEDYQAFLRPHQIDTKYIYEQDNWSPGKVRGFLRNNNTLYSIKFHTPTAKKTFEDETGLTANFPLISSLPKPAVNSSASTYRGKIYMWSAKRDYYHRTFWNEVKYNNEQGYYILTDGTLLEGITSSQFRDALLFLALNKDTSPIFRIPKSDRKKLLKSLNPKMVSLKDYLDDQIKKLDKNDLLKEQIGGKLWITEKDTGFLERLNCNDPDLEILKKSIKQWKKVDLTQYSEFISRGLIKPITPKVDVVENVYKKGEFIKWMEKAFEETGDVKIISFTEDLLKKGQCTCQS